MSGPLILSIPRAIAWSVSPWWRVVLAALAIAALAACPARPASHTAVLHPSPERLAAEAQALARTARAKGIPGVQLLVEAYLSQFRPVVLPVDPQSGRPTRARRRSRCRWLRKAGWRPVRAAAALSDLHAPSPGRMRAFVAALLDTTDCRTMDLIPSRPRPPGGHAAPPGPAQTNRSGSGPSIREMLAPVGGFSVTRVAQRAGVRVTRSERWVLKRHGAEVTGFVLVQEHPASTGDALGRCDDPAKSRAVWVHRLHGKLVPLGPGAHARARLKLSSVETLSGPGGNARVVPIAPLRCGGVMRHGQLVLRCPDRRVLRRFPPAAPLGPATGVYTWRGVSPRPDGGRESIRETWFLVEQRGRISGFYWRVTQASARPGARFECNHAPRFRRVRMYLLSGQRAGTPGRGVPRGITLRETLALGSGSPCDKRPPRLDHYQGRLRGPRLRLSWGSGSQTLTRARPDALPLAPAPCK